MHCLDSMGHMPCLHWHACHCRSNTAEFMCLSMPRMQTWLGEQPKEVCKHSTSLQSRLDQMHSLAYQINHMVDKTTALLMQVVVARATRRRQLLRKDFGMQPVKLIHATPTPVQPAFAVKQPAFSVKRHTGRGSLHVDHKKQDRRQLAAAACDEATSDATFGDINFDCQFTFVQV